MSRPQWITDSAGKITGYKTTAGGADTVFPFSSLRFLGDGTAVIGASGSTVNINYENKPRVIITYAINEGHHNAVYWENGAYGFSGVMTHNEHLLPYDVTINSFKIKSANPSTYTVQYWCFG